MTTLRQLPTGEVTFLFTDIEGSTRLLDELGKRYAKVLADHHRLMRASFEPRGGVEVDTAGDAFFVAFERAPDALAAAAAAQEALAPTGLRVRMGIHTGQPLLAETGYVGIDVHQGARVMSAGHGGQVLVSDATRALLDGSVPLTDLGLHRLKDLTEPQRLWQLGDEEFPPLKTLYQTNLPVQPTPLIGRERELSEVIDLLRRERLVTLTGAGGSGKTRLALQAAAELTDEFKDGVWWVSLAALRDPDLVEPTIAQALGEKDDLREHVRQKRMLVLLDNFEQVVAAAPVVAELLQAAPDLRMLVTSRERLGVAAEHEYLVPTMEQVEAVALFTARARQVQPDFEPDDAVAEVCRRVDGLPLAIELAAARVKLLAAGQILDRLGRSLDLLTGGTRDAPDRQQTLRATIEWSYELLTPAEAALFVELSVFAGSFSIEAAESVCGAEIDALAGLVDKSLLRRVEAGRFFLLETIREFGAEKLDGGADAVRRRHATWFVELATERDAQDSSVDRLDALERDLENFRAALEWSLDSGDATDAVTIAIALSRVWEMRDRWVEGSAWYRRVVAEAPDAPPVLTARARLEHAVLLMHMDDWGGAERLLAEARPALLDSDDTRDRGRWLLVHAGIAWMHHGDIRTGVAALEEALTAFRSAGDVLQERVTAHHLGEASRELGDLERAAEWLLRSIELSRSLGDTMFEAASLHGLGDTLLEQGDDAGAESAYRDSLRISYATRFEGQTVLCLAALAAIAARRGDRDRAAVLWASVEAFEGERGARIHAHERRRYEAELGAVPPARARSLDEAAQLALAP